MIEAEVHQQLRRLLRQSPEALWPHQLTMARMVARGLRLQRSALIQIPAGGHHRLSYLLPALMWSGPALLCAPAPIQAQILRSEIPWLQQTLHLDKPVIQLRTWPDRPFSGLGLVDPHLWLQARLRPDPAVHFPAGLPLLIDGAEHLESWVHHTLTHTLTPQDWYSLQRAVPHWADLISQVHVRLTLALLQRPPSHCLLHEDELALLQDLWQQLPSSLPDPWSPFRHQSLQPDSIRWAEIHRQTGQVVLHTRPADLRPILAPLWSTQPLVLMGEALDLDREALAYRQRLTLPDLTPLRFLPETSGYAPDQALHLYLPRLPAPNSPLFREQLLPELKALICGVEGPVVVLVSDQPLQTQVGTALAAEFGSRVQVNLPTLPQQGILVCDWDHWLDHRDQLPPPLLLAIVTLPFPSVEDPQVAGQVEFLKRSHQDWFRTYLLPQAAAALQRGVAPLHSASDPARLVAILDSRITGRSYGAQLLEGLGPIVRLHPRSVFV